MTWVAAGATAISAIGSIGGALSNKRKAKAEARRLRIETGAQQRAAQLTEGDLFAEADASYQTQLLISEREKLADKAGEEALRQARLQAEGPDIFLTAPTATQRGATRGSFFDEAP